MNALVRCGVALLVAGLVCSATSAHAGGGGGGGGGGTKRPTKIVVTNDSTAVLGVTTDATSTGITDAISEADVAAFTAAGGKFISIGGTATFQVGAGTYDIGAIDEGFANAIESDSVTVNKGTTLYVTITGDAGDLSFATSNTPPTTTTPPTVSSDVKK